MNFNLTSLIHPFKEPELTEEERTKYATAFTYFDHITKPLYPLNLNINQIDQLSKVVEAQVQKIKTTICSTLASN